MSKLRTDLKKLWAQTGWLTVVIMMGFFTLMFLLQLSAMGCATHHEPKAGLTTFHTRHEHCFTLKSPKIQVYHGDNSVCPEQKEVKQAVRYFLWGYGIKKKYDKQFDGWKIVYVAQRISCPGHPDDWEDLRGKQYRGYRGCSNVTQTTITLQGRASSDGAWTATTAHELCHKYGYIRGFRVGNEWHSHYIDVDPPFGVPYKKRNPKEGFCFKDTNHRTNIQLRKL